MSADNYLLVSKSNYRVMSICASSGYGIVLFTGKTLKEAENFAIKEDVKNYYEYGIHFTTDKIGNRYRHKEILEEKKADMESMKKQANKIAKNITKQMEEARIADYIDFLEQENQELKKLNIAQVRENAQIRIEKAKIEKQLSEIKYLTKERIVKVLEEVFIEYIGCIEYDNHYKFPERNIRKDVVNAIASEILGDDKNEI